jgi:hypothetical protein
MDIFFLCSSVSSVVNRLSPVSCQCQCQHRPGAPCYTSPFPSMLQATIRSHLRLSAFLLFIALAINHAQQPLPSSIVDAAGAFTQEILSHNGLPDTVMVSFNNLSSLSPSDQSAARESILARFRIAGIHVVKADAATELQVSFSEDWQGLVWIANIKQNNTSRVLVKKIARPQRSASIRTATVILQKTLIWSQDSRILDFIRDDQTLLVLEPEQISIYQNDSGRWKFVNATPLVHDLSWPRDLRGRLQGTARQFTAFLPGTLCTGTLSPPQMQCRHSDDPWQMDRNQLAFFSSSRNFFTGVLAGQNAGASVPPFFSIAAWQNGDKRQWLFAGTDGKARLYQGSLTSEPVVLNEWGSDVVAVHSGCSSGWQILVSSSSSSHSDSIQAMEIVNGGAMPVSMTLEISGAVRALWPSGEENQTANAVVESATGKYEAYALTVSCNR